MRAPLHRTVLLTDADALKDEVNSWLREVAVADGLHDDPGRYEWQFDGRETVDAGIELHYCMLALPNTLTLRLSAQAVARIAGHELNLQ